MAATASPSATSADAASSTSPRTRPCWNYATEYGYTKDEVRTQPVLRLFAPDGVKEYTDAMNRIRCGEHNEPYDAPPDAPPPDAPAGDGPDEGKIPF